MIKNNDQHIHKILYTAKSILLNIKFIGTMKNKNTRLL